MSWWGQAGAWIPAVMSQCIADAVTVTVTVTVGCPRCSSPGAYRSAAARSVPRVFCGVLSLGASRQPPRTWPWHPGALSGHCGPGWQRSPGTHSGRVPEEPGTRRRSQSTALTSASLEDAPLILRAVPALTQPEVPVALFAARARRCAGPSRRPPELPGPSCQAAFPQGGSQLTLVPRAVAPQGRGAFALLSVELPVVPGSPACPGASGWQQDPLGYRPQLPVWPEAVEQGWDQD